MNVSLPVQEVELELPVLHTEDHPTTEKPAVQMQRNVVSKLVTLVPSPLSTGLPTNAKVSFLHILNPKIPKTPEFGPKACSIPDPLP